MYSEDFESICEVVHNAWWEEKKSQGVIDHPDMIPYAELSEDVKDYDRVTVRAVLDALKNLNTCGIDRNRIISLIFSNHSQEL